MPGFPEDCYFYIKSLQSGMVFDIDNGSTEPTAALIVYSQKDHDAEDNDNQLWRYDDGYIINKKSGHVLDISGGDLKADAEVIQYGRKLTMTSNQRFGLRDGYIYARADPRLVLSVRADSNDPGSKVSLTARKTDSNRHQQFEVEPHQQ
ncbi:ricin B lectin domain-containing protein [Fennellomyces sp. T-0311]|nr:ricin B lectin domain-containing protein [Fennellomyces sp. T-0311]